MWINESSNNWYALFVKTGEEDKIRNCLEKDVNGQVEFIVPKRELRERKAGKWHTVRRTLFPGYILLKGQLTVETYYQIKRIPLLTKLLKDEDGPLEIEGKEIEVITKLLSAGNGNIGFSKAFRENEEIRIIEGPLAGLEGRIQSVDIRKGRARVKLNFLGEERIVQLGIDVISPAFTQP